MFFHSKGPLNLQIAGGGEIDLCPLDLNNNNKGYFICDSGDQCVPVEDLCDFARDRAYCVDGSDLTKSANCKVTTTTVTSTTTVTTTTTTGTVSSTSSTITTTTQYVWPAYNRLAPIEGGCENTLTADGNAINDEESCKAFCEEGHVTGHAIQFAWTKQLKGLTVNTDDFYENEISAEADLCTCTNPKKKGDVKTVFVCMSSVVASFQHTTMPPPEEKKTGTTIVGVVVGVLLFVGLGLFAWSRTRDNSGGGGGGNKKGAPGQNRGKGSTNNRVPRAGGFGGSGVARNQPNANMAFTQPEFTNSAQHENPLADAYEDEADNAGPASDPYEEPMSYGETNPTTGEVSIDIGGNGGNDPEPEQEPEPEPEPEPEQDEGGDDEDAGSGSDEDDRDSGGSGDDGSGSDDEDDESGDDDGSESE